MITLLVLHDAEQVQGVHVRPVTREDELTERGGLVQPSSPVPLPGVLRESSVGRPGKTHPTRLPLLTIHGKLTARCRKWIQTSREAPCNRKGDRDHTSLWPRRENPNSPRTVAARSGHSGHDSAVPLEADVHLYLAAVLR